jgi:hypothetical protein
MSRVKLDLKRGLYEVAAETGENLRNSVRGQATGLWPHSTMVASGRTNPI